MELALVLGVAFSASALASVYVFFNRPLALSAEYLQLRLWTGLVAEIMALCVLAYVLYRQGRSWRDLGMNFKLMDIPVSIGLMLVVHYLFYPAYYAVNVAYFKVFKEPLTHQKLVTVLNLGITAGTVLFVILNAFYEEVLVRAYFITEVHALSGSKLPAIVASTTLQTIYHLYQGIDLAIGVGVGFLILSIYFAVFKRAWPIILAHFYLDAMALLFYPK